MRFVIPILHLARTMPMVRTISAPMALGVTRSYEWRVEQLDRMAGLLAEHEAAS
jgi:hypothetical protein